MASKAPLPIAPGTAAPKTSVASVLTSLASAGSSIVLGVQIGEEVVPLVVGVIADVKQLLAGTTITYQVAITSGDAFLEDTATIDQADLALINAELVRQGQPALTVPADDGLDAPPSQITQAPAAATAKPAPIPVTLQMAAHAAAMNRAVQLKAKK